LDAWFAGVRGDERGFEKKSPEPAVSDGCAVAGQFFFAAVVLEASPADCSRSIRRLVALGRQSSQYSISRQFRGGRLIEAPAAQLGLLVYAQKSYSGGRLLGSPGPRSTRRRQTPFHFDPDRRCSILKPGGGARSYGGPGRIIPDFFPIFKSGNASRHRAARLESAADQGTRRPIFGIARRTDLRQPQLLFGPRPTV